MAGEQGLMRVQREGVRRMAGPRDMGLDDEQVLLQIGQITELVMQHGDLLHRLEQRPLFDQPAWERRMDDMTDAVEHLALALARPPEPDGWWPRMMTLPRLSTVLWMVGAMLIGAWLCWSTVRYMPTDWLPPGFTRPGVSVQGKGK